MLTKTTGKNNTFFWILFLIITMLALAIRFYQIEARPLHSDESVNWSFLRKINESGVYSYSSKNFHGPLYFWLSFFAAEPLDFSVLGLRIVSIICGIGLLPVLLLSRKLASDSFVILSSLFIAVSPGLVFHSRYGIHESLLLFLSLSFALSLYLVLVKERILYIYFSWVILALLIATKETFLILCLNLGIVFLLIPDLRQRVKFIQANKDSIIKGSLLFTFVLLMVFSSGFKQVSPVRELFYGSFDWIWRGTKKDVGHFKIFEYYLQKPLGIAEPALLWLYFGLIIFGLIFILRLAIYYNKDLKTEKFGIFLGSWSFVSLLTYSLIPYKTPWLVINFSLPMILYCCYVISRLSVLARQYKIFCTLCVSAYLVSSISNMAYFNYNNVEFFGKNFNKIKTLPYGPGNPYSYVHTSPGMMEFLDDVKSVWQKNPDARILIGTKAYWPLPYYLRHKSNQLRYNSQGDFDSIAKDVDIVTIDSYKSWTPHGWHKKYYRFSDITEANVYFREPVTGSSQTNNN